MSAGHGEAPRATRFLRAELLQQSIDVGAEYLRRAASPQLAVASNGASGGYQPLFRRLAGGNAAPEAKAAFDSYLLAANRLCGGDSRVASFSPH